MLTVCHKPIVILTDSHPALKAHDSKQISFKLSGSYHTLAYYNSVNLNWVPSFASIHDNERAK